MTEFLLTIPLIMGVVANVNLFFIAHQLNKRNNEVFGPLSDSEEVASIDGILENIRANRSKIHKEEK